MKSFALLLLMLFGSRNALSFLSVTTTTSNRARQSILLFGVSKPVASTDTSNSTAVDSISKQDNDWWKHVEFQHADVAQEVRQDFPILTNTLIGEEHPLIYLDSAATSQKPNAVVDALVNYYQTQNSNVHRGAHSLSRDATASYEDARDYVTQYIGAKSRNEIVFTSGATEAINLISNSFGKTLQRGDEIVLTVMEHHSNLVPWQMLAEETGAVLRFVPIKDGGLDMDAFQKLLTAKTKLVTFQHVSNVMACINPVEKMVDMIRKQSPDAKILLDACQSVPHLKVDVQELGIDFMAASGHKACGPTGIGFLWGKEDLLNSMSPFMGGGEMIDTVTLEEATFAQAPARFEAGTPPIAQAIGMAAALKYLSKLGLDRIEAYEHEMAEYLYKRLSEIKGIHVLGPSENRAALCAFVSDTVHPSDLSSFLDMEGVAIRAGHHCCQPLHQHLGHSHSARASLYFYNTKEDIDVFIEKLQSTLDFFNNLGNDDDTDEEGDGDGFVPFI